MPLVIPISDKRHDAEPTIPRERMLGFTFRLYKAIISPVLHAVAPSRCLYLPTCSEYAYIAVSRFGVARGSWMALARVARCHPWGKGGLDLVPECRAHQTHRHTYPASSNADSTPSDHLS